MIRNHSEQDLKNKFHCGKNHTKIAVTVCMLPSYVCHIVKIQDEIATN